MRRALALLVLSLAGCASRPAGEVGRLYRQPEGAYLVPPTGARDLKGAPNGFVVVAGEPGNTRHGYGSTPDEAARNAGATSWQTPKPVETVAPEPPPAPEVADRAHPEKSPTGDSTGWEPAEECPGGVCRVPGAPAHPIDDRERCGPPSPPAAPPAAPSPEVGSPPPPPAPSPREPANGLVVLVISLGVLVIVLATAVVYTARALRSGRRGSS